LRRQHARHASGRGTRRCRSVPVST
jgi:hypothetical protein